MEEVVFERQPCIGILVELARSTEEHGVRIPAECASVQHWKSLFRRVAGGSDDYSIEKMVSNPIHLAVRVCDESLVWSFFIHLLLSFNTHEKYCIWAEGDGTFIAWCHEIIHRRLILIHEHNWLATAYWTVSTLHRPWTFGLEWSTICARPGRSVPTEVTNFVVESVINSGLHCVKEFNMQEEMEGSSRDERMEVLSRAKESFLQALGLAKYVGQKQRVKRAIEYLANVFEKMVATTVSYADAAEFIENCVEQLLEESASKGKVDLWRSRLDKKAQELEKKRIQTTLEYKDRQHRPTIGGAADISQQTAPSMGSILRQPMEVLLNRNQKTLRRSPSDFILGSSHL